MLSETSQKKANTIEFHLCVCAQSCLTLCDSTDRSLSDDCVHGIFQARTLERLSVPSPGNLPNLGIEPVSSASPALAGAFFTTEPKYHWCSCLGAPSKKSQKNPLEKRKESVVLIYHCRDLSWWYFSCSSLFPHLHQKRE